MSAPTRVNPFKAPAGFAAPAIFGDFFRGAGVTASWCETAVVPGMRVDIAEDDKAFPIEADVPGADKGGIEVSVERNQMWIGADIKGDSGKEDEKKLVVVRQCLPGLLFVRWDPRQSHRSLA